MMWKWKFEGEAEEAVGEAVTTSNVLPSSSSSSAAATSRWLFSPQPSSSLLSSSSSPAPVYKIAPATHTAQSVLNAAACLIVVSLTNLWSYLHTLVVKTVWISVCANYYQSVITEANKTINLIAAAVTHRRGLNTALSSSSTLSSTTELESTVVVESSTAATPPVVVLAKVYNTTPVTETTETVKMTIEVPAEYTPAQAALPVLRINSVNIEDPLLLDSTQFLMSSSDGEDHDRDHLFTDDSELSSSNERGMGNQSMMRRDSDTSDVSSTDGSTEDHCESAPELTARIINQVENMFSDEHLSKDGFLLKHVRRRSDGFVSLKLVAGLRKVKQISREFPVILSAVQKSDKLEVNSEGTKIRRVEPLTTYLKSLPIASQKSPKEKEVLSKSPSSSGDDLPGRNANGTCLHFPNGFSSALTNDKENKRQNGRNGKVTRNNKESSQKQQQQSPQKQSNNRSNNFNNSSNDTTSSMEREIILRRRGGSLPITMAPMMHHNHQNGSATANSHPTPSYLSPNSSPPNRTMSTRPKSNSYCEGLMMTSNSTMSPWLQRRKAASEGNVVISSVIRQPRGPDGTRGFSMLPRPPLIAAN